MKKKKEMHDHHSGRVAYTAERAEHEIEKTLSNPPETWKSMMAVPGGLWKIVEMEFGEAQAAYKAMKTETGTHHAFVKQLCHVMSAAAQAYAAMTCDDRHNPY